MDQLDSCGDNNWDTIDINSFIIDDAPYGGEYHAPPLPCPFPSLMTSTFPSGNACFQMEDGSGLIDDKELDKALSSYNHRTVTELEAPFSSATFQEKDCIEAECPRKRGRNESCNKQGNKACRERLRREKLNERFSELCSVLEPGRPVKTDKMAILGDAIRVLNQLKTESEEYKEMNQKLMEEIKTLKAEKNELREEKLVLKADKERMEQELTATAAPPASFIPPHSAPYQLAVNKMAAFPYGYVPMWQYLPPSTRDTSQDHELRPPAA